MASPGSRQTPPTPALGARRDPQRVVGRRILAALIDIALVNAIVFGIIRLGSHGTLTITPGASLLLVAIPLVYYFAGEAAAGQTPGKHLLDIEVVRSDGRRADASRIGVRTLLRLADNLPVLYGLGLVVMLWTERRQRIGDLFADTIVVRRAR